MKAIRTGGEDVFPDEVEALLCYHPQIVDAAVVGVNDRVLGKRLVALVEPIAGASITLDDVVTFFTGRVAGYRVPREVICVEKVKRLENRKPDYEWASEPA